MPDSLTFSGYLPPPSVPPDPSGDDWRGLQGPQGIQGIQGPVGDASLASVVAAGTTAARSAAVRFSEYPNILDWGPANDGVTDDSAIVKTAHDAIAAAGGRFLFFPATANIYAPTLLYVSNVIFVGPGRLTGAYRKQVIPLTSSMKTLPVGSLAPFLKNFNARVRNATAGAPAIFAIIGDSTSVATSSTTAGDGLTDFLRAGLIAAFGASAPIVVVNFGIGSQTWTTLDGIPSGFDYWYTDHGAAWLTYPQNVTAGTSTGADAILIAMGMNDQTAMDPAKVASVIGKIKAWSKVCDIVLMTNHSPSTMNTALGTQFSQENHEYPAGYVRSYALKNGLGLIDANRWRTIIRDGFDPLESNMRANLAAASGSIPYTFPTTMLDWSWRGFFGSVTGLFTGRNLVAQIGNNAGNIITIERDSGTGNFAYTIDAKAGANSVARTVTAIAVPSSGSATFGLEIKGSHVLFWMVNSTYPNFGVRVIDCYYDKFGGLYTPQVRWSNAATTNGVTTYTAHGIPALYMPWVTDYELFGDTNGGVYPYGGSGGLHLSSIGQQLINGQLITGADFSDASAAVATGNQTISGNLVVTGATTAQSMSATTLAVGSNGASGPLVTINGAASQARLQGVKTAGVDRWQWGANATAEGGTNAGSDFVLNAYSDAGASMGAYITVQRSSGQITVNNLLGTFFPQSYTYDTQSSGLTAAGTTTTDALVLTSTSNEVTTTAAGTGVRLPTLGVAGPTIRVFNRGANTLNVYPATGDTIDDATTDAPATLTTLTNAQFTRSASNRWHMIKGA